MRKLTTQEFIDRARTVHGNRYNYTFSVYQSAHEKVIIHCPEHGLFEQSPNNHLNGRGCLVCSGKKKHTSDSFINQAKHIHGNNKFDYSKVVYKGNKNKITIICPEHGDFEQTPHNHLHGQGCPSCSGNKKHDNDSFISQAKSVHGNDKFDYSKVEYVNVMTKVTIICSEHGDFLQEAQSHLKGSGCPGCANYGFDRTRSGFLYVLRSECGTKMKIGITNNLERRHTELTRATPFSFKRIELIEGPGEQIANLEKELLAEYLPAEFTETFNGYSEWRLWSDSIRHKLISFMDKELTHGLV